MMNQPTGRFAPDSVFPPSIIPSPAFQDIKGTSNGVSVVLKTVEVPVEKRMSTDDICVLAADQMIIAFATDSQRSTDSHPLRLRFENVDDKMRAAIVTRLTRGKMSSTTHSFLIGNIRYVVEVTHEGRDGVLLKLVGRSADAPASTL